MKEKDAYKAVATAVRVERDDKTDTMYLVFQVTDEKFKQKVKKDWNQDIDLKIQGKDLIEFEEG